MPTAMNVNLLIDALVRQTTVLIAQLATSAGARATLAHTANQVFTSLVAELREQGVGNKVIADMFGLSLRTYHNQVARLSEARSERGRSLWAAVLAHLQTRRVATRAEVLLHFAQDDEATVRGVLRDLTESGLVFSTGKGHAVSYRVAEADEVLSQPETDPQAALTHLVRVAVHRFGPINLNDLAAHIPADTHALQRALQELVASGQARRVVLDEVDHYSCEECVIAVGDAAGWEAAIFDHYQAMVTAICTKLAASGRGGRAGESIGGSTYAYDIWPGHPMQSDVMQLLTRLRTEAQDLRHRLEAYNASQPRASGEVTRVITYVGQTVLDGDPDSPD